MYVMHTTLDTNFQLKENSNSQSDRNDHYTLQSWRYFQATLRHHNEIGRKFPICYRVITACRNHWRIDIIIHMCYTDNLCCITSHRISNYGVGVFVRKSGPSFPYVACIVAMKPSGYWTRLDAFPSDGVRGRVQHPLTKARWFINTTRAIRFRKQWVASGNIALITKTFQVAIEFLAGSYVVIETKCEVHIDGCKRGITGDILFPIVDEM